MRTKPPHHIKMQETAGMDVAKIKKSKSMGGRDDFNEGRERTKHMLKFLSEINRTKSS